MNSFLMIGQSNMAGRGYLSDVAQIYDEQIKMLVNGRWQTMTEPINFDRPTAGIGLAASFAGALRSVDKSEQIGLIPCADGGTSLEDWAIGGTLFESAVFHTIMAQRTSELKGILWHQGENDSFGGRSEFYCEKLSAIVDAFRDKLGAAEIPFIAGGIGEYLASGRYGKYFTEHHQVNQALLKYAKTAPNAYFVTSGGLTSNQDGLHFDAISQRRFGIRYFDAYLQRKSILSPHANEDDLLRNIYDRPLNRTEKIALLEIDFAMGKISTPEYEKHLSAYTA